MKRNSISTNIIRDENAELEYIVTPNTKELFDKIFTNENITSKSFNLIGNYGTGKSTFLWALEKNLTGERIYFGDAYAHTQIKGYEILKIIGDNDSLSKSVARQLKLGDDISSASIIESLEARRIKLKKKNFGFVLMIDEFGKFLEYASKNNTLEDLYLVQLIAEWANDTNYESRFLVTVHQNLLNYAHSLSNQDRLEWEKVKGRFTDVMFNEPVEQLIYFASNSLKQYSLPNKNKASFERLVKLIDESNLISLNKKLTEEVAEALFPLDWLSANILVNSLQRYGQNERSLFSFLGDNSKYSVSNLSDSFFSVTSVFDYLVNAMPSEIMGPLNPHKPQWQSTFRSLERAELVFNDDFNLACKVIKTIGLVNIFSKAGGVFNNKFLVDYFKLTEDEDITEILSKLETAGLTRFYKHSNKVNFIEGTDIDLERELIEVSQEINPNLEISKE